MPINSTSESYQRAATSWRTVRDVLAGGDAMRHAASRYLMKPQAMSFKDWASYIQRAPWFPGVRRVVDGMLGEVFRKEPEVTLPERLATFARDVDLAGRPLATFARTALEETLALGRFAVLTEWSAESNRPFLAGYAAESLINWRVQTIDGIPTLVLAVLKETATEPDPDDMFAETVTERFRVLELARDPGGRPAYTVSTYKKRRDGAGREEFIRLTGPIVPRRRGRALGFIPLAVIGPSDISPNIAEPPLEPLADLNIGLWRLAADREWALHYTGTPVIAISGRIEGTPASEPPDTLEIGPGRAVHLEKGGQVELVSASAESIGALAAAIKERREEMAVVGGRLLAPDRGGNPEHRDTTALRFRGEDSVLMQTANTVSAGLTKAAQVAAWWAGASNTPETADASIALNTDFNSAEMTGREVTELVGAWMSGGIGAKALHAALVRGEFLPPELEDYEAFAEDLETTGPAEMAMGRNF